MAPLTYLYTELTTRCALRCSRCPRTMYPKDFDLADLPVGLIRQRFKGPAFEHLRVHELGGNYGDPIYHPQFVEVLSVLVSQLPKVQLVIHTNGSHRKAQFWHEVSEILRPTDMVLFSIDGLDDTNGLYRQGVDTPSIFEAIRILKGRVQLRWKYIVFKHNEHQIESAISIAERHGFQEIRFVRSSRFGRSYSEQSVDPLEPSARWRTQSETPGAEKKFRPKCLTSSRHYITATGHYRPCCWIGHSQKIQQLVPADLCEQLSLHTHSMEDILASPVINEASLRLQNSPHPPIFCQATCSSTVEGRSKDSSIAVYLRKDDEKPTIL